MAEKENKKICGKTWIDDLNFAYHRKHKCWLVHSNAEMSHDGYAHECSCGRQISDRHV